MHQKVSSLFINEGFPYLWVNGEKYSFTQEVLDHGSKLMVEFFKLEHYLRDVYGKINGSSADKDTEGLNIA